MANIGERGREPRPQRSQIESPSALVNLDRVAPAKGDVRLGLSLEIREIAAGAGAAGGILRNADGLEMAAPNISRDQAAVQGLFAASQKLEGFGDLERSDEIDDGA